jgi:hypothetical protein
LQIAQFPRFVELNELAIGHIREAAKPLPAHSFPVKSLGFSAAECPDHRLRV